MNFREYTNNSRELISERLSQFCEKKRGEELPLIFKEQRIIDSLESFALRGKLIRGTLFLFIAEAKGVKITDSLVDIAVSIELIHSSLLIQDDIIDRDYTRRGADTIFAKYEQDGKEIGAFDAYHYGVSTAIMVADVAYFFALELIANSNTSKLSELLKYFSHEIYLVALAESADSIFGQTNKEPTQEEIYSVYKYKTARYTFSMPFEMAAIVSDTEVKTREILNKLGELSGIIFQLRDDEIGLFGDEKLIGKPVGSDIRENKKTIIRALLYEKADAQDKVALDECFGNENCSDVEIEKVKSLYEKYAIKSHINSEIEKIMKQVWDLHNALEFEDTYKQILKELLEFNMTRSA